MKVFDTEFNKRVLGENLGILRRRAKYTQKDLARLLGCSTQSIIDLEQGKTEVKNIFLMKLLKMYEYEGDVRYLYLRVLE